MVVNNDAPTYTTQTETEYSSSENNISGWKALLIASTPAQQSVVNLKFLSATVWLLTTMMVVGVVFCGVREEGVFSDFYLWMSYQVRQMVMLCAILENGATWNLNAKRSLKESDARLQTLELHLSWLRPGHCFVFVCTLHSYFAILIHLNCYPFLALYSLSLARFPMTKNDNTTTNPPHIVQQLLSTQQQ